MFFSRRPQPAGVEVIKERFLPKCYDEFRGTKIYNIIEHPKPTGERVFLSVKYAGSAAVKARGARWDPDARRWWYFSDGPEQGAKENNPDMWLEALEASHARSVFAEWPIDTEYMRRTKFWLLEDYCDFSNPAAARVK